MITTKDREDMMAASWCIENNILISPAIQRETYTASVKRDGRTKKINLPKVKIQISIEGSKNIGKKLYRQDTELWDKVQELKTYYWHGSKDYINYLKSLI